MLKNIIYKLQSFDPFKNIAFENWLLYHGPSNQISIILWRDRPCIVIGRNQNPWIECNVPLSHKLNIPILRRYSGGGTVYHDLGCAIWSIIMPRAIFSRDLFCDKLVKLLNDIFHLDLIVNKRHDICTRKENFKVSGSAFKIIKDKAVHHGTLLLKGSNLTAIHDLLMTFPFQEMEKDSFSNGISSVRSPVTNLSIDYEEFENVFLKHFSSSTSIPTLILNDNDSNNPEMTLIEKGKEKENKEFMGNCLLLPSDYDNPEMMKFENELRSKNWIYSKSMINFKIPHLNLEIQDGIITSSPNHQYNGILFEPEIYFTILKMEKENILKNNF